MVLLAPHLGARAAFRLPVEEPFEVLPGDVDPQGSLSAYDLQDVVLDQVELLELPEYAFEENAVVSLVRDGDVLHVSFGADLRCESPAHARSPLLRAVG